MDQTNITLVIGGAGFMLTFALSVFSLFRFVSATSDTVRKELTSKVDTQEATLGAEIRALRTEVDLKLDRLQAVQDRARHDDKNLHSGQFLKLEQAVQEISRTAVRKDDMLRMEKTLDAVSEKVNRQAVLESQLTELIKKLEKVEPALMQLQARGVNL